MGESYLIESTKIKLTCYEPPNYFNDSITLIEFDDIRILNLNDAGINKKIANQIGSIDILTTSFGSGASGYPLTWYNLSEGNCQDHL